MEQRDKKRRMAQNAAFYTALAVCLIAAGVGAWQLLQPEGTGPDAQSGAAAVSGPAALPDMGAGVRVMGPDAPEDADASAESGDAASESGEVPAVNATDAGEAPTVSASDAGATEPVSAAKASESVTAKAPSASKETKTSKTADAGSAKAASDKKSDKAASEKSGKGSGDAVRPVNGEIVTGYSMDKLLYNETMRDWRTHDGIDIAADAGTAVVAAKAGTVESVEADPIMGMTVAIRHEEKWETVYSSLTDAPEVEAGDEVSAGQVIGFVGETAASESALGPHLHFSVLNDGAPSDPEAFLS